jgi:hypothetical protein
MRWRVVKTEKVAGRIFPNCFRCDQPFDLAEGEPQYIYCPPCRAARRREPELKRHALSRAEGEGMGWSEFLDPLDEDIING